MKKDIYIIKNSINDKVYIGQSKNAAERWLSHLYNTKYEAKTNKEVQVIHRAMTKYGVDKFHYEILESQIEDYDEKEQYWISKYNSRVPNGYNVAVGGKGSGAGIDSPNTVFESKYQLLDCISEISCGKKSLTNIAKKYNCSLEVIISINKGDRYKQDWLLYPLRETDQKYSLEKVKQIRYSLKYETDLSLNRIAKKYDVDLSQVSLINQGRKYYVNGDIYPLRRKRVSEHNEATIESVIDDIINSDLALSDIACKYNISRSRVTEINRGKAHRREYYTYPLRSDTDIRSKSLKKFIDLDIIKEIHLLLKGDMSIKAIAKKYSLSTTTIHNINCGRCKKYIIDGESYPIRRIN